MEDEDELYSVGSSEILFLILYLNAERTESLKRLSPVSRSACTFRKDVLEVIKMLIFIIRLWLIINSLALSLEDSHRIRRTNFSFSKNMLLLYRM